MSIYGAIREKLNEIQDLLDQLDDVKTNGTAEPESHDQPAPPGNTDEITEAELRDLLLAVHKQHGRDKTTRLLSEFGASKLSEVKPASYPAFYERSSQLLRGAA